MKKTVQTENTQSLGYIREKITMYEMSRFGQVIKTTTYSLSRVLTPVILNENNDQTCKNRPLTILHHFSSFDIAIELIPKQFKPTIQP